MEEQSRQRSLVTQFFKAAAETMQIAGSALPDSIIAAAEVMRVALESGGKILVCGNGGSAAESQHFTAELVGRYKLPNRQELAALALISDTVILTAWANDIGYDLVFARQVETLVKKGDVLVGISTSRRSKNVIEAFEVARRIGVKRVAILRGDGGEMVSKADVAILVPSRDTARIQEVHLVVFHVLSDLLESGLQDLGARLKP